MLKTYIHFILSGLCLNTLNGHTNGVLDLTLLPNGLMASASQDNSIMIWDIAKTFPLYTLKGHSSYVKSFSIINNTYLVSSSYDLTIKIWSLSSYSIVQSWQASTFNLMSLAYDSTSNLLASGDKGPFVKVWDSDLLIGAPTSSGTF